MRTVTNPPTLEVQETPSWCFAAAEQMILRYYGHAPLSQYAIARSCVAARAAAGDPEGNVANRWEVATGADARLGHDEADGRNLHSEVVKLVRSQWGIVGHEALGGRYLRGPLDRTIAHDEIDADRIFLLANQIHFYVVYGYEGDTLFVLDPWPAGKGGKTSEISLATVAGWPNGTTILFG